MKDPGSTSFLAQREARRDYGAQFEILVSVLYHQVVKAGDIVVDGGANAGLHAMPLARLVGPTGLLVAFEPNPPVFAALQRNVAQFSVELHQLALSDKQTMLNFVADEKRPGLSHLQHQFDQPAEATRTIAVQSVTLDSIVGARPISFIKLDLEGADFLALRGAARTLRKSRPPVIFENNRGWAAKCHHYTAEEFFAFFADIHYIIYDLHGHPLTRDSWEAKDMAFEFLALPEENVSRNRHLLGIVAFFWREADQRPVLPEWKDCIAAAGNAYAYMTRCHGQNWLSLAATP